jgi:hypothetical protein
MEQLYNKIVGVTLKNRIFVASNFNLFDYIKDSR